MDTTNSKANIQKKILVYARDIALDKLNKKLEKKIAKQQIRKKENENVSYQRVSQNSDSDYIRTSSEFTSSSSDNVPLVHTNEKSVATASITEPGNNITTQKLLNQTVEGVGQSALSINSSGQDEDYQTADEDEESPLKKDDIETKPNEINGMPKNNDFIVEICDDKNDKLVIKPTLPQGQVQSPPHPHPHHSGTSVDYSGYIQKKSLAQGMMDLALVSANTNQLRYIIEYKEHHPYFLTSLSLVIASLFLQLAVGMTLIWNTRFNVKKRKEMQEADKVNNFSVIGIFIVTLINVFLSTFGGAPQGGGGGGTETSKSVTLPAEMSGSGDSDAPIILH